MLLISNGRGILATHTAWFGVNVRTIERKRKNPAFVETIERGRAKGKISLRRSQLKMVDQGNPAMAIWLGKQYLGQTDEIRHALNVSTQLQIVIPCGVEAQPAGSRLIDAAEDLDAEIEAADYETV
jgi:hypothetical protein